MAAGVFGTAGATFQPAASSAPSPDGTAEPEMDDGGLSDEDILELEEPLQPLAEAPAGQAADPVVAELPLTMPERIQPPQADQSRPAPAQPERRQTCLLYTSRCV